MRCKSCHQDKDKSEFSFRKDSGKYRTECKSCRSRKQTDSCHNDQQCLDRKKKHWAKTKDAINAAKRAAYDPIKKKGEHLKYLYGISLDDYNALFQKQEGKCAVCEAHQSTLKRALVVDHDHETGEVRGLLCDKCNLLLGQFNDRPDALRCAAEYLERGTIA